MGSFIIACVAVILIAAVGATALDAFQVPVDMAFTTIGVRN